MVVSGPGDLILPGEITWGEVPPWGERQWGEMPHLKYGAPPNAYGPPPATAALWRDAFQRLLWRRRGSWRGAPGPRAARVHEED